jgi:predicted RNase H-like nuclease
MVDRAPGSLYVGAVPSDGEGWFAAAFDREGFVEAGAYEGVGACWSRYEDAAGRLMVGAPIGSATAEGPRSCDELARAVLGERGHVVPDPPVREAARKRRYPAAARVHERVTGRELDERAFELADAAAALDDLLGEVPEAREVVAESHPEVCFTAFAGEPPEHPRSTAGGYAERMRALAEFDRDAPPAVQSAAEAAGDARVTVHDVLDALALAYTARPAATELQTLPPDPPTDAEGLPMAIHYRAPEPLDAV